MPLTPAHAAAVLPLGRTPLPMEALVIGAIVPDLPVFISRSAFYDLTHSKFGILTVDVLLGLFVLAAWLFFLREPLRALSPSWMQRRLAPVRRYSRVQWGWAPLALLIGAGTHVVWDSFTHLNRWGMRQMPALAEVYGNHPGFTWLQFASSAVGVSVVAGFVVWRLMTSPDRYEVSPWAWPPVTLPLALLPAAWVAVDTARLWRPFGLHQMSFQVLTETAPVLIAGAVGLAGCWHAVRWQGGGAKLRPPEAR